MANSKVDSVEAESSRLRKDLIEAMNQVTKAKEKLKEHKDALKVEKKLVIQKDEEVQGAFLKIEEECEKVITNFLSLIASLIFNSSNTSKASCFFVGG